MSVFNRSNDDDFGRGAKTLIIYPDIQNDRTISPEARLEEAEGLALAIGLSVIQKKHMRIRKPNPATLVGGGQVDMLCELVDQFGIELIYCDAALTAIPVSYTHLTLPTICSV